MNSPKFCGKRRYSKGGVDFETSEIKFILDENHEPVKAVLRTRTDATGLVEEKRGLAANQTVALHIKAISKKLKMKGTLPFLYRVHDEPHTEKIQDIIRFLQGLGVTVNTESLTSKDVNDILKKVEELPEKKVIHQLMLRSDGQAHYSDENIGHYGSGFSDYAHFTSPIRRYPDAIVHRVLKEYAAGTLTASRLAGFGEQMKDIGEHCSITERTSVEAERASTKIAQVEMARRHVGEVERAL